ncbi:hypothetical protein VNO77_03944 [Canavalia gladiata]|uniref:Uncharacterized protein n=1 Tax=Canavalia gladiata TaxID=3824 RepID=A0AAN9MWA2_CANGL
MRCCCRLVEGEKMSKGWALSLQERGSTQKSVQWHEKIMNVGHVDFVRRGGNLSFCEVLLAMVLLYMRECKQCMRVVTLWSKPKKIKEATHRMLVEICENTGSIICGKRLPKCLRWQLINFPPDFIVDSLGAVALSLAPLSVSFEMETAVTMRDQLVLPDLFDGYTRVPVVLVIDPFENTQPNTTFVDGGCEQETRVQCLYSVDTLITASSI